MITFWDFVDISSWKISATQLTHQDLINHCFHSIEWPLLEDSQSLEVELHSTVWLTARQKGLIHSFHSSGHTL